MRTPRIGVLALAVACGAVDAAQARIDVSGTWNLCLGPPAGGVETQRPVGVFTQVETRVSGTVTYSLFGTPFVCLVGFDIDPTTGAFVPGASHEQCPFGATNHLRPALATTGRIDGEHRPELQRSVLFGLRACDPLASDACDDGDPATTDACSTSVDCFGDALPASCIHTGCTSDADCADAYPCTFDRCDPTTGCAHPAVLEAGEPRPFCEDGDPCTLYEQCDLTACGTGQHTTTVTRMGSARLRLGRLGAPGGDDTFRVAGRIELPAPLTIAPAENGIRVRVLDATGATVVDERLPGGAFDPFTGMGWSVDARGVRYADRRKVSQGPLRRVAITSALGTPGLVKFEVEGQAGTYRALPALPLGVFVNLDVDVPASGRPDDPFPLDGGTCAEFAGPAPACSVSRTGRKIRCR